MRGPAQYLDRITAPTLLIQGTVDTLFTLEEAHRNAMALMGNGVATKVVWYCGGHGACISSSTNDGELIERATLSGSTATSRRRTVVDPGPQFEWVDQHGQEFSSDEYPIQQAVRPHRNEWSGSVLPLLPVARWFGTAVQGVRARPHRGAARGAVRHVRGQRGEPENA